MTTASSSWILQGSRTFYQAGFALFLLGFASFSLIYCVQPLFPAFTKSFSVSASSSSLSLSLTTGFLAVSILLSSAFSQALGRKGLMFFSMSIAALLNLACAFAPNWTSLLVLRSLEGFVLGGVPAVAMAWIAEEIHPKNLSKTMGLYIGGTAFGGMMGRVGMGLLTEYFSWRVALGIWGTVCVLCAISFYFLLPSSQNFTAKKGINLRFHLHTWKRHLCNVSLFKTYCLGFLLTSIFISLFNYITFRFSEAPYCLSQTQISFIFLSYSFGILSSSLAGQIAHRIGTKFTLCLGFILMLVGSFITLFSPLFYVILGIGLITTGFFIAHAMASSQVSLLAQEHKGHATSLYLLFYYLGSSIVGSGMGVFWQYGGWNAVVSAISLLIGVALIILFCKPHLKH